MIKEIEQFYKRFDIEIEEKENIKRFKNSLSKILEKSIGNISLKNEFRDVFIKYTGIDHKDFGSVDIYTEIDYGQTDWLGITGKNYIKFSNTCIGKAFQEDISNVIKYIQIIFLMDNSIISRDIKEELYENINEIIDLFGINVNILKEKNKYLLYPKGAKELDETLVNDVLVWLERYDISRKKFISALQKYQNKDDIRHILDDLRFSLEKFIQEIVSNGKSLENNKSEIGKILKDKNINVEIANMYMKLFDYYTIYQNNNVKHNENCAYEEIEFMIYLTGSFMRLLLSII